LNAVVAVDTASDPATLLQQTQAIERGLGREATYHWGPRRIDLDILLFGEVEIRTATLTIPHPEICQRAFVLIPLLELAPDLVLPDGTVLSSCLPQLNPPQQVRRFAPAAALSS
jgi:2-amino-4-hydroxy-6-hydroxymethyldihydropteridine diphosphokinase